MRGLFQDNNSYFISCTWNSNSEAFRAKCRTDDSYEFTEASKTDNNSFSKNKTQNRFEVNTWNTLNRGCEIEIKVFDELPWLEDLNPKLTLLKSLATEHLFAL